MQLLGRLDASTRTATESLLYTTRSVANFHLWQEGCQQVRRSLYPISILIIVTVEKAKALLLICSGQFFEQHLKFIKLNDVMVRFTRQSMSYLLKVKQSSFEWYFCNLLTAVQYSSIHHLFEGCLRCPFHLRCLCRKGCQH